MEPLKFKEGKHYSDALQHKHYLVFTKVINSTPKIHRHNKLALHIPVEAYIFIFFQILNKVQVNHAKLSYAFSVK